MTNFKYVSIFSGVGGFDFGLNAVGGECVFASEIDKFAKQAYTTLHGLEPHGDITKIDAKDIPDHDVIAAGFPCQSFSVAGKRGGFEDARGTLFFEVARIASEKQPKVLLLENVKGLVGHDKGKTLDTIVKTLNEIGYRVDFEVLNSKYFGVPQNRERIFISAVREDLVKNEPWNIVGNTVVPKGKRRISGYEDVKTFNFDWPTNDTVEKRLVDVLESKVDEKYYLDEEKTSQLILQMDERIGIQIKETEPNKIAGIYGSSQAGSVWDKNGMSPTLKTNSGGYSEPIITEEDNTSIKIVGNPSNSGHGNMNVHDPTGISPTITARDYKGAKLVAEGLHIQEASEVSGVKQGAFIKGGDLGGRKKEKDTVEILLKLREEIGAEAFEEWRLRVFNTFQQKEVLRQTVYEEALDNLENRKTLEREEQSDERSFKSRTPDGEEKLRNLLFGELLGRPSFRRESVQQLTRELTSSLSILSHEGSSPQEEVQNMFGNSQRIGLLRQALSEVQEVRRPSNVEREKSLRIRKLVPIETWRLQGFTDEQHNAVESAGISNSQRYKMAGNAVTVNVIEAIGTRLLPYL